MRTFITLIFILVTIFSLNACSQAKQEVVQHKESQEIRKKEVELEKLFLSSEIRKSLNIKTNLTDKEKEEIFSISSQFDEIAKHFAYQEHYLGIEVEKQYCPKLIELYNDLSNRPISREREREREREYIN